MAQNSEAQRVIVRSEPAVYDGASTDLSVLVTAPFDVIYSEKLKLCFSAAGAMRRISTVYF